MKKYICNRCGKDEYGEMYGTSRKYAAFDKYIYPQGDLCKGCLVDFRAFLKGHAIPAVEGQREYTKKELKALKVLGW